MGKGSVGRCGVVGVGSACGVDACAQEAWASCLGVGVGVDNDDAVVMGNAGVGRMGVGGVGDVGVDGLVLARVASGLPWTREVACPRAFWHSLSWQRLYLLVS